TDERAEAHYAETYFGDDKEDYDVIKVNVDRWPYYNEATDGTMESWQGLWDRCVTGFVSNADYFALEGKDQYGKPIKNTRVYVDIDNLIDYMLTIFYTGNVDAPVSAFNSNLMPNNYYAILNRKDKGKGFVFIAHDSEHSMFVNPINVTQGLNENRVTINDPAMKATGIIDFQPQWLHDKLAKNSEYRQRFADRAYLRFAEGGVLTTGECLKRLDARRRQVDMPIIAESARWGDAKTTAPRNKTDDWLPEVNSIINNYIPYRSAIVISQLKTAGLYGTVQPVIIRRGGVSVSGDNIISSPVVITFANPNAAGTIYYTTDGTDPRSVGGTISATAIVAANSSTMNIAGTTVIRARVLSDQLWSPLKEVSFSAAVEDYTWLKVTEVNYNPSNYINGADTIDSKDLEFIELKNTGINSMNISGVTIDSAVYYRVPEGVILPPKAFYVIASKPESFYEYYGMNASGNFKGNLSNGGEFLLVYDRYGAPILSFTYSDDEPWPKDADGRGKSLVSAAYLPKGDPDNYKYWKTSQDNGGSPFADDGNSRVNDPAASELLKNLTIYPNPATEVLYINFDDLTSETIKVRLTDLSGRTVMITEVENNTGINLDKTGLRAGVYVVTAEYNGASNSMLFVYQPAK
ncbi:MAG TPA: lamin tail domain-containing protein, partial [Bacteroidales bacterium]|nr:lamin tail domain-containing protein [Bacteroidales bacterium]